MPTRIRDPELGMAPVRESRKPYYPRYIGLAPRQAKIASGRVFEILVAGRVVPGAVAMLSAVAARKDVSLHPSGGYYSYEPGKFVWTTFADLSGSSSEVEDIVGDLRKHDFVEKVEWDRMSDLVFDHYLFPVLAGNDARVIVFRLQPLLDVEQRLMETFGSAGASIMFNEGRAYALATLQEYKAMLPGASPEVLIRNVVAGLRTTGWGLFSFDVSRTLQDGSASVTIGEPPNAVKPEMENSFFTNGLVAGVIEGVIGKEMKVTSSRYDHSERMLWLTLSSDR